MTDQSRVAVIGHGVVATGIAEAIRTAGNDVDCFDPATLKNTAAPLPVGMEVAVAEAGLVLSLNSPALASRVAERIAPLLKDGALYADLNTGTPAMKKKLAALFPEGTFSDVAVRTSEPGPEANISLSVAGTGAGTLVELLVRAGLSVEYISEVPGDAAARQILRSVLDKGMAAAIIDFLWAAESLGQQNWAYQEVLDDFTASTAETAKGYLTGTAQHLKRRQIEMMDIVETMRETGHESTLVPAIETNYSRILHGKRIPFSKAK